MEPTNIQQENNEHAGEGDLLTDLEEPSVRSSVYNIITTISRAFGVLVLIQLVKAAQFAWPIIKYKIHMPLFQQIELSMLVVGFAAAILFYKRKFLGWVLFVLYCSYNSLALCYFIIGCFKYHSISVGYNANIITRSSPIYAVLQIASPICMFWVCRNEVRKVFSVTNDKMIATFTGSALVIAIALYSVYSI